MRLFAAAVLGFLGLVVIVLSNESGAGRRFWYPTLIAVTGPRTHEDVRRALGPKRRDALRSAFSTAGLPYPSRRLTLVGLKEERRLEVWAEGARGWVRVRDYAVLAASGQAGPKLREGDTQVPEGEYRLTGFNPNSSYHLSIRVDYPSREDRAIARAEGRTRPGGDIFIHGKAVSIGCLAIGDDSIEDLYLLLADTGLANARILLTPSATPTAPANSPAWLVDRYERLRRELTRVRATLSRHIGEWRNALRLKTTPRKRITALRGGKPTGLNTILERAKAVQGRSAPEQLDWLRSLVRYPRGERGFRLTPEAPPRRR